MGFQRPAVDLIVFVNGQANPSFQVLEMEESLGSNRMNYARLRYDLGNTQVERGRRRAEFIADHRFIDGNEPAGFTRLNGAEIEVVGNVLGFQKVFHYGHLGIQSLNITDDESLILTSRIVNSDFGIPIYGQRVVDTKTFRTDWSHPTEGRRAVRLDIPIVFNPRHTDGTIRGNKRVLSSKLAFIDPSSVETESAKLHQKVGALADLARLVAGFSDFIKANVLEADPSENWSLPEAVLYLMEEANGFDTWIREFRTIPRINNPPLVQLEKILPNDRGLIKNHTIRAGAYLPEALDQLLTPYGFTFKINLASRGIRFIQIVRNGSGPRITAHLDRPKTVFSPNTEAYKTNLHFDVDRLHNQVRLRGGYTRVEATFELTRAWPASQDDLDVAIDYDKTDKDLPDWDENPDFHRTWRHWVLNEGADHARSKPFDMTKLFRQAFGNTHPPVIVRRRKFLPMLTVDQDGEPYGDFQGVYIEFFDRLGTVKRVPIRTGEPGFSVKVLKNECGILFTGTLIPLDLYDSAEGARVWVTAVIESDTRLETVAKRQKTSANKDIVELVFEKPLSYHLHKRLTTGVNASIFSKTVSVGDPDSLKGSFPATLSAKELDGRKAIAEVAETIRESLDQAECSGTISVDGLDRLKFQTGHVVTKISGRNIQLEVNTATFLEQFPQIVAVKYFPQTQLTTIILKTFRTTESRLGELLRNQRSKK